jgi:hypothetical protein
MTKRMRQVAEYNAECGSTCSSNGDVLAFDQFAGFHGVTDHTEHEADIRADNFIKNERLSLQSQIILLRIALADAIFRPIGVTPSSADGLITQNEINAAERRMSALCSPQDVRHTFEELVADWKLQSKHMSSVSEAAMLSSYQRIIGLGPSAVPLLLRELEQEPNYWFWALRSITGYDPVPESSRGNLQEMTNAWLKWGRENGLVFVTTTYHL